MKQMVVLKIEFNLQLLYLDLYIDVTTREGSFQMEPKLLFQY